MDRDIHGDGSSAKSRPDSRMANDEARKAPPPISRKSRHRQPEEYKVIIDLPAPLPVTDAELDLLESELSDFIADLLRT